MRDAYSARPASTLVLRLPFALGLALLLALTFATSARAVDTGHSFSFSFKASGTAEFGQLVAAMDVDNSAGPSAGALYVADSQKNRVLKFDSDGDFVLMFGKEVNATTGGNVCTAASGNTCKAGVSGSTPEHVPFPWYLAVDSSGGPSSGDVYVASTFPNVVRKFDENGNLEATWDGDGVLNGITAPEGPFGSMLGIDTDSSGRLLVSWWRCCSNQEAKVSKFNQDGTFASQFVTAPGDTEEGFAWTPGSVFRMRPCCQEPVLTRSSDANGSGTVVIARNTYQPNFEFFPQYLNSDPVTGAVYQVMEDICCTPPVEPPMIWEWQFDGSGQPLDSEGNPCPVTLSVNGPGCEPTNEFGQEVLTRGQSSNAAAIAVHSATDTVYVADIETKSIKAFVGAPAPIAETGDPIGRFEVSGTAKPDGAAEIVECYFEFGETTDYGSQQECSPSPVGYNSDQPVTAELPGLSGDGQHTYHYRLVATNADGATSLGEDKSFRPQYVTGLETLDASDIQRTTATLNAEFDDIGEETKYYFEWGESTSYTEKSAVPPGPVAGSTSLSFNATGLKAGTVHHYRVVAENSLGITYGDDVTFETLPAVQSLTTLPATAERRSAILKASYDGDGTPTTWKFEWGTTTSYGNSTTVQGPESPSGLKEVTFQLTGLELETTYHVRVSATNGLGTTIGGDQSFTTLPAVPGLVTKDATGVGQDSVTLNAEYIGNGEATSYYFEYGLTTEYDKVSAPAPGVDIGSPTGPTPISAEITDYEGYETYHYRVVAVNPFGVSFGEDKTFTALPALLPEISNQAASDVAPTAATLQATINPNRWATVYTFEYGPSSAYGESTEISSVIGNDQFDHQVEEALTDLAPGSVYHYRTVAINFTGTAYGPDQVFATPAAPDVAIASASAIGESSAHLSASVNPNSSPTSVRFEYGPSTAYGASTAPIPAGSGFTPQNVGADIGGLAAGTTYHFRVIAQNGQGTSVGSDQTFTTLGSSAPAPLVTTPRRRCRKGFVRRRGKCVRKRCRKGFAKRKGKCVRKKQRNSKRKRRANRRNG